MRIISKNTDYYDGVQGVGMDPGLVFVRHAERRRLEDVPAPAYVREMRTMRFGVGRGASREGMAKSVPAALSPFAIAFCGRFYFGAQLAMVRRRARAGAPPGDHREVHYDAAALEQRLETLLPKGVPVRMERRWSIDCFTRDKLLDALAGQQGQGSHYEALVRERLAIAVFRTPLWGDGGVRVDHVEVNAELKDLEFYRRFDAYRAYQELAMFVGGVLACGAPEMVSIADKDLARAKGYDEWSFRRPPQHTG